MHLRTILNSFHKQAGFIYGTERWEEVENHKAIVIPLIPHARSKPVCSCCGKVCPCYDTLKERLFRFVPF